ncbi:MAG: S1C family serine protease [Pseudomonadales bacterium]|nr:S1C family serine protease [Pseudomonadales bacterium]
MSATILPFARPLSTAVMALQSHVPTSAMTADMLGTDRQGHAVQVSPDGLLLSAGYLLIEADEVWLSNHLGQTVQGIVLAQDYDSGLALLKPQRSLGNNYLETAAAATLKVGDDATILSSSDRKPFNVQVFAREEFAGRWEYLLDEAIYTLPLFEQWSGAALLNAENRLCGIGSLALGLSSPAGKVIAGNMFVPVDLVMPHLEYMSLHGSKPGALRPWLGVLVEAEEPGLTVLGLYAGSPAAKAGIRPGDRILAVGDKIVSSLPGFFRSLWHYGPAGSRIPMLVSQNDRTREVQLHTTDRNTFFMQHEAATLN